MRKYAVTTSALILLIFWPTWGFHRAALGSGAHPPQFENLSSSTSQEAGTWMTRACTWNLLTARLFWPTTAAIKA
jgi:hypothetical protein